ncbi:hypothetical protein DRE_06664 [Drechslerella stenobrocha 248]|uniref:Uncharacterized protein n=1 Tax=Drechslerella stenobrocha 248 TaxID=1043628 RepID=W7HXE6_9PEZI|nr:hypothetical protein DRE_06664 [Drechslerella stenobrocha 248]
MPPRKSKRISSLQAAPPKREHATRAAKRKRQDLEVEPVKEDSSAAPPPPKRGKPRGRGPTKAREQLASQESQEPTGTKTKETTEPEEPPRRKRFRATCPQAIAERWDRMRVQRMFCLGRQRDESALTEEFKVAGSTGNVYTVLLANVPRCNCPDSRKNGTCKHILFVMSKVLRVRDGLAYQAALLNSELLEIFAHAPASLEASIPGEKRKRKPLAEEECPICYEPFGKNEASVVYCMAQCGSNIHKECFRQWAASKSGSVVTCVICRTPWEDNSISAAEYGRVLQGAKVGNEGYLNVADEMGMTRRRDTSTYNRFYNWQSLQWQ